MAVPTSKAMVAERSRVAPGSYTSSVAPARIPVAGDHWSLKACTTTRSSSMALPTVSVMVRGCLPDRVQ